MHAHINIQVYVSTYIVSLVYMCTYIYMYICICERKFTHMSIVTRINLHYICAPAPTHTHPPTHTRAHTHIFKHTRIHTHTRTHAHTHTHTHICIHKHICTHTHIHTYIELVQSTKGRGQSASPAQLEAIQEAISELEATGGERDPITSPLILGSWELLYTSKSSFDIRNPLGESACIAT